MKFITERELRDLYKVEPFTTYVPEPHTKITPGARQFLVDRGIKLADSQCSDNKQAKTNEPKQPQGRPNWRVLRLRGKMEYIESLFLLGGAEFFGTGHSALAEEIMILSKCFKNVQNAEREQIAPAAIQVKEWTEEVQNSCNHIGNHMEISEVHVRMENGKQLALLNHLRASLGELEPAIMETYWNEEKQACSREDLIDKVNLIINILCIIMWKCLGGQQWKR